MSGGFSRFGLLFLQQAEHRRGLRERRQLDVLAGRTVLAQAQAVLIQKRDETGKLLLRDEARPVKPGRFGLRVGKSLETLLAELTLAFQAAQTLLKRLHTVVNLTTNLSKPPQTFSSLSHLFPNRL